MSRQAQVRRLRAQMNRISVTGLFVSAMLGACGADQRTHSPAPVTARQAASSKLAPARAHPRMLADYDDDDYLRGYEDYDPDDHSEAKDRDGDIDMETSTGYYDRDDGGIRKFGRAATAAQRGPIVALTERYYAAAASDEGARICAMMDPPARESYVQTVGEHGPRYAHGLRSCAQIISKVFAGSQQMMAFSLRLGITAVRLSGEFGLVVLGSKPFPIRVLEVIREHGKWFVFGGLDTEMA